jgi:hypothetical protein
LPRPTAVPHLRPPPRRPPRFIPRTQAKLLSDTRRVVSLVIALRGAFPTADLSAMLARQPRLLLRDEEGLKQDAEQVRARPRVPACLREARARAHRRGGQVGAQLRGAARQQFKAGPSQGSARRGPLCSLTSVRKRFHPTLRALALSSASRAPRRPKH